MSKTKTMALAGLLVALLLVSVTQARAETVKYKLTAYGTKSEAIPVGDVEGHYIGVYEGRGLALFENGEVATYLIRCTWDYIKGQGTNQGYVQLTYEDGSTTVAKFQGAGTKVEGRTLYKSKGEYIKGTGRFKGIQGHYSYSGKRITPYSKETKGDTYAEVTATYTLPSK